MTQDLLIGSGEAASYLLAQYANRHGLVAGATGTGKTITLQVLAEGFSEIGVPVVTGPPVRSSSNTPERMRTLSSS